MNGMSQEKPMFWPSSYSYQEATHLSCDMFWKIRHNLVPLELIATILEPNMK